MGKLLSILGLLAFGGDNIAPDAVTRATQGYNVFEGQLASLTDGLHPANHGAAASFYWPTKGNLVFQFTQPEPVIGVRVYVGSDGGAYQVRAYIGAVFTEEGQTGVGEATLLADAHDASFAKNGWVELAFAGPVETDYLELATDSGAELYEIEILAPPGHRPTAIPQASWAAIKATSLQADRSHR